jgi:hypothetical protein
MDYLDGIGHRPVQVQSVQFLHWHKLCLKNIQVQWEKPPSMPSHTRPITDVTLEQAYR